MTRTTTSITRWRDKLGLNRSRPQVKTWLNTVKSGLILALVPFLLACEDDNFLSLPADPGQQSLDIRQTRIPVTFSIVRQDSVNTSTPTGSVSRIARPRLLAGQQRTALGLAEATTFMDFTTGPRSAVGDTATYQSLELELVYDRSYGTTQQLSQSLEVHRLVEPFVDSLNVYYNSESLAFADPVLGTVTNSTKFTGGLDTLRYRLDDALGQTIFDLAQAGDSTVLAGSQFREFLPGLALVPTATNSFVSSFNPAGVRLIMNFTDAQGELREYTFVLRLYFSQVTGDYSGTPLAGLTEAGSRVVPDDGNLYLQSGTGVSPRIGFDSLLAFVRSQTTEQQSIRLNRVSFNVGLRDTQDTLNAPRALYAYTFAPDTVGVLQRIPVRNRQDPRIIDGYQGMIGDQGSPPLATPLVLSGAQYRLPITNYLAAVVESDTTNQRLYLWANDFESSTSYFATSGDSIYLDVSYTVLTY